VTGPLRRRRRNRFVPVHPGPASGSRSRVYLRRFFVLPVAFHVYESRSSEPLAAVGVANIGTAVTIIFVALQIFAFATICINSMQVLLATGLGGWLSIPRLAPSAVGLLVAR
jgi:hypothetical protein